MSDELSERSAAEGRQQPIGTVQSKNPDGTVNILLNLDNPDACKLVADAFTVGIEEANRRLFANRN